MIIKIENLYNSWNNYDVLKSDRYNEVLPSKKYKNINKLMFLFIFFILILKQNFIWGRELKS